jgi:hypothetical protein
MDTLLPRSAVIGGSRLAQQLRWRARLRVQRLLPGQPIWVPQPVAPYHAEPADQWQVDVMPYGWAINLNGSNTIDGVKAEIDVTFIDIVENADTIAALEGRMEARKGKFSLLSISDYFKSTFSENVTASLQPNSALSVDVDGGIDLDFELILSELSATYEIFKAPAGQSGGFVALDALAGGRYNSVDVTTDVVLNIGATLTSDVVALNFTQTGQARVRLEADEQWVDPFVGMRLRMDSGTGYEFFARGDVGGFGANSEFVWQAIAGIAGQCGCNENLSWAIGYRALDTDYSTGSGAEEFAFDMLIHGPVIGDKYSF